MLKDISGVGALQDALTRTNELLAAVLDELKETNSQRLDEIATELRSLNEKVGRLSLGDQ
jgi:outer membrane murein-binding lipoprotein Lpp